MSTCNCTTAYPASPYGWRCYSSSTSRANCSYGIISSYAKIFLLSITSAFVTLAENVLATLRSLEKWKFFSLPFHTFLLKNLLYLSTYVLHLYNKKYHTSYFLSIFFYICLINHYTHGRLFFLAWSLSQKNFTFITPDFFYSISGFL